MSSWAIVAIPAEQDPVWRYSSEKVPHMTLLFLGEQSNEADLAQIALYVEHVASTSMQPFGMSVDRRGSLGPDEADVLFFDKNWTDKSVVDARTFLLADTCISKYYNSIEQYPEWLPHLTMGYPETPAKEDTRDYPGISYVQFDKIALWIGDFTGPEFQLKRKEDTMVSDVAWADKVDSFFTHRGVPSKPVDNFLNHFGIKGMHWGVRGGSAGPVGVSTTVKPGQKVKAKGGTGHPAHTDAVASAVSKQKARKSSTDSLSTQELRNLVDRMNLEQQYSKLSEGQISPGRKFVSKVLGDVAKEQASKAIRDQAGKLLAKGVKAGVKTAAKSVI